MASYDDEEYEGVIRRNAVRAFKKLQEEDPKRWSYTNRTRDEVISKYDSFLNKLRTWKPRDQMTRGYEYALNDYSTDSLLAWLEGKKGAKAPDEYEGQSEASKILPLLSGVAKEGEDWYSMGSKALKSEAKRLGYNTNVPGAYPEFLNLVRDYQTQYDRAQLLKEGQQGANYWLNKLLYPSSTQEAENAVLTGQGGDEETLRNLRRLDAVTSGAMLAAPTLSITKVNPLLMGFIDAGIQGAAEAGRQLGTERLSDTGQEADYKQALNAFLIGSTRPGMAGTATAAASQLPTGFGKDFARGVMKGTRTGGSAERANLAQAVKLYNKKIAGKSYVYDRNNELDFAVKVPEIAEMFNIKPAANGMYSAKDILKIYDLKPVAPKFIMDGKPSYSNNSFVPDANDLKPPLINNMYLASAIMKKKGEALFDRNTKGVGNRIKNAINASIDGPDVELGQDLLPRYTAMFPDKALDINQNKAAAVLGRAIGAGLSEVGGRVEPTIKENPINIVDMENVRKNYKESYKNQKWYKDLNEEQQKLIDEVFKKKAGNN